MLCLPGQVPPFHHHGAIAQLGAEGVLVIVSGGEVGCHRSAVLRYPKGH